MHICQHCNKEFVSKRSLNAHRCEPGRKYREAVLNDNRSEIIDLFVNHYWSVIDIANKFNLTHLRVAELLKSNGIPYDRDVINSRRVHAVAKSKETFIAKYGVDNPSKAESVKDKVKSTCMNKYGSTNGGWSLDSQIKHYLMGTAPNPSRLTDYDEYVETVNKLTRKNKQLVSYTGTCYYSGVEIHNSKHWNHPFSATIDHKTPVLVGFEKGMQPEQIASVNNLVWCCKLLNNYKRAMTEEQFRDSGIIERFKEYEGYLRSTSK
jgi:hypothetical protein